jgi:hypothetical protein
MDFKNKKKKELLAACALATPFPSKDQVNAFILQSMLLTTAWPFLVPKHASIPLLSPATTCTHINELAMGATRRVLRVRKPRA